LPSDIPPKAILCLDDYEFNREFIYPSDNPENLYNRLSESPIGVTVRYASDANTETILNPSGTQNHNVLIVGAKYKEYWIIYDSYSWQK